jgi:cysteine desulfurase
VSAALRALEASARARCHWLAVPSGLPPDAETFAAALGPTTHLAAMQWVNHETGTVLPVADYAARCRERGVRLFVDATQALGKLPVDVQALGADLVALASHKIGGPAGAGALWVRRGTELASLLLGGSQERGRRAGTPDVLAQVGFGAACVQLPERLASQPRLGQLRDRLEAHLLELGAIRNASAGPRVATVTSCSWPSQRADILLAALDVEGLAASSGAACSSGKSEPSAVLLAMHPDEPSRAGTSTRFSFGPETTDMHIEFAMDALSRVHARSAG